MPRSPSPSKSKLKPTPSKAESPASAKKDLKASAAAKAKGSKKNPAEAGHTWQPTNYGPVELFVRVTLGPLLLMVVTPLFINLAGLAMLKYDGSLWDVLFHLFEEPKEVLKLAFVPPTLTSLKYVALFAAFQAVIMGVLPGKIYSGPVAPSGYVPKYKANGLLCFLATLGAFVVLAHREMIDPCIIHRELLSVLSLLNASALFLSILLFVKGAASPSTPDHGSMGQDSILFRVFYGEELYPRIFWGKFDVKLFVISRLGMMGWAIFTLSFAYAALERHGHLTPAVAASAGLLLLYVLKFFALFEIPHYVAAADIAIDRLGFMLAWGTLAFMPLVHSLMVLRLVAVPGLKMSWLQVAAYLALGCALIYANWSSDTQRHYVRETNGQCLIWGRPATFIRAKYSTADGKVHEALLSTCGWNGLVRHFHYAPDIILLVMYAFPAGTDRLLPWVYCLYLTALLLDRTSRIDARCAAKYGPAWDAYVAQVPYKLIPGLW